MLQIKVEKTRCGDIPVHIVHPIEDTGRAVIFYHGWSSSAANQISRAALLAVHGYTVYLPDAVHSLDRDPLPDYFTVSIYDDFWNTIFSNMDEFAALLAFVRQRGCEKPFIMGHSMGGMSVMGIAAKYPRDIAGVVSFNGSGDWLLTHLFTQARFAAQVAKDWPLLQEIEEKNPLAHIDAMKDLPMLLTNGEADPSVDPRAQTHFLNLMSAAGGQAKQIIYPRLAHFVTTNMMDDAVHFLDEIKEVK